MRASACIVLALASLVALMPMAAAGSAPIVRDGGVRAGPEGLVLWVEALDPDGPGDLRGASFVFSGPGPREVAASAMPAGDRVRYEVPLPPQPGPGRAWTAVVLRDADGAHAVPLPEPLALAEARGVAALSASAAQAPVDPLLAIGAAVGAGVAAGVAYVVLALRGRERSF